MHIAEGGVNVALLLFLSSGPYISIYIPKFPVLINTQMAYMSFLNFMALVIFFFFRPLPYIETSIENPPLSLHTHRIPLSQAT